MVERKQAFMAKPEKIFSAKFQENYDYLFRRLGADINYDIIPYELTVAGHPSAFFMVQGFVDDTVLAMLLSNISALSERPSRNQMTTNAGENVRKREPSFIVDGIANWQPLWKSVSRICKN